MISRPLLLAAFVSLAAVTTTAALEASAQACGGCFVPTENNTVVTDHRMILSISLEESTLYDQIEYQGAPESFAWVLPIRGEVNVGVSADAVFAVMDSLTRVQVQAPPRNCPPPPYCQNGAGPSGTSQDAGAGGVSVLKQETVGPYETVQLRSSDPEALRTWLTDRNYKIPADVASVITSYVGEKFDFLAVKLVPGNNVQAMAPIRVTTKGASPQLPLRMVAAGTGANVGITLWVVADGRWEPQNFPSFSIKSEDLIWNWNTSSSNFKALREKYTGDLGPSAWEIESSSKLSVSQFAWSVDRTFGAFDPSGAYTPVVDPDGNIVKTATQVFEEDMQVLLHGGKESSSYFRATRMRADLPQASLSNDLQLQASSDQSELARIRQVTKEANQPACPIYQGCDEVGTGSRDDALAANERSASVGGGACSAEMRSTGWLSGAGLLLATAALLATRRGRARA